MAEKETEKQLFTIPTGAPFLRTLAAGILRDPSLGGRLEVGSAAVEDMQILLPNRRAVKSLRHQFLEESSENALLLPRIAPIGEGESDEEFFSEAPFEEPDIRSGESDLFPLLSLPAIGDLERHMTLTAFLAASQMPERLQIPSTLSAAASAGHLIRLMDHLARHDIPADRLTKLSPASLRPTLAKSSHFSQCRHQSLA